jgi:hypothetical protein
MKIGYELAVGIVILMAFSNLIWGIPGSVRASPNTAVNLTLLPQSSELERPYDWDEMETLEGKIKYTISEAEEINVSLIGQSSIGTMQITPSNFVISGENGINITRSFNITTKVPHDYPSEEKYPVTVSGYFTQNNLSYSISPVSQKIRIRPYYKMNVEPPPPQEIAPGEFVYFDLIITNMGNVKDTYEFVIQNCGELCGDQWTIATLTPKTFAVGQTQIITFSAQAPQTWTLYRNKVQPFKLRILSQNSMEEGGNVRYDVILFVRQRGQYIPGFSPTFALFGLLFVSIVCRKMRCSGGKTPKFHSGHPKDLYGKLSMNMR